MSNNKINPSAYSYTGAGRCFGAANAEQCSPQEEFEKQAVHYYATQGVFSCVTDAVITPLLTVLAGCNEKIAVADNIIPPIYFALKRSANKIGINLISFKTEQELEAVIKQGVKAVFLTSASYCAGPAVHRCSLLCKKGHIPLVVDNTVITLLAYNPIDDGADIVIEMSEIICAGKSKYSLTTLADSGKFNWMYTNGYSRLYPFCRSKYPLASYVKTSCKRVTTRFSNELQTEYNILLRGFKTLRDRTTTHSRNCERLIKLVKRYSKDIQAVKHYRYSMFFSADIKPEYLPAVQKQLEPVNVRSVEKLFDMYSCTGVCFNESTMYVKCGIEPYSHLEPLFRLKK